MKEKKYSEEQIQQDLDELLELFYNTYYVFCRDKECHAFQEVESKAAAIKLANAHHENITTHHQHCAGQDIFVTTGRHLFKHIRKHNLKLGEIKTNQQ